MGWVSEAINELFHGRLLYRTITFGKHRVWHQNTPPPKTPRRSTHPRVGCDSPPPRVDGDSPPPRVAAASPPYRVDVDESRRRRLAVEGNSTPPRVAAASTPRRRRRLAVEGPLRFPAQVMSSVTSTVTRARRVR